jgi:hypothetical protein
MQVFGGVEDEEWDVLVEKLKRERGLINRRSKWR